MLQRRLIGHQKRFWCVHEQSQVVSLGSPIATESNRRLRMSLSVRMTRLGMRSFVYELEVGAYLSSPFGRDLRRDGDIVMIELGCR